MKRLFLSHREKHPQVRRFELALRELIQIEPVLLEDCPKIGGMPPGKLSEHYMKQCAGVLFLLTKDMQAGDQWHPSPSVSMEITLAEQLFSQNMRFYMLERDVTFPAMAEEPTYISFSWDEMITPLVDLHKTLYSAKLIEFSPITSQQIDAPLEELLFVLERAANNSAGIPINELSDLYQHTFKKDHADFSILLDKMKKSKMVREDSKVIRGDGVLRKVTVLIPSSWGLQFLGRHRDEVRARRAESITKGLKAIGLIK